MTTNNEEQRTRLAHEAEKQEAGITELLAMYERLESVYTAASQASLTTPNITTANTTNRLTR